MIYTFSVIFSKCNDQNLLFSQLIPFEVAENEICCWRRVGVKIVFIYVTEGEWAIKVRIVCQNNISLPLTFKL